jgi:voltage-gated potassium channel
MPRAPHFRQRTTPVAPSHEASPQAVRAHREMIAFLRRLGVLLTLLVLLMAAGTLSAAAIDQPSLWRAFLWSLDTISTLGAMPWPADAGGQVLRVALIVLGVGTLFYGLVTVTEFFVAGHLSGLLENWRTQRMVDALSDHYVICGYGRVGRQVARDLGASHARYVVIDDKPENRELARSAGIPFIEGEAADDEVLRRAGVQRARAVLACVDSDSQNVFITLTAREINPAVTVVARASHEDSEAKLKRAGADRVVSPYKISGAEMARLALHPQVAGVLDVAPEYRMEEIEVTPGCAGAAQTIADVRGAAVILALRRADGTVLPQPPSDTTLEAGDLVTAMGSVRTLERLEALFTPGSPRTPAVQ